MATRAKELSDLGNLKLDVTANGIDVVGEVQASGNITAGGNIGIKQSNPAALLHIGDSTNSLGETAGDEINVLRLQSDTANTDSLMFTTERLSDGTTWQTAAHRIQRKVDTSLMGYLQFGNNQSDLITFGKGDNEYVRIDGASGGNVGIGTDSPGYRLTVQKDVDSFVMKVENDGDSPGTSGASYADASDGLWVDTRWNTATNTPFKVTSNSGTSPMMIIKGDGKFGIGTDSPGYKLEVAGTAHVSNTLSAGALTIPSQGMAFNQAFGTGVPSITMTGTANNGRAGAINFKESDGSGGAIANTAAIYATDGVGGNSNYGGITIAAYQSDIRFSTATLGGTKMIVKAGGNVGIGTTDPKSALDIVGAIAITNGDQDLGTHTHSAYASLVNSGCIKFTAGYSGTLVAGRTFTFKYNAVSWKAYHGTITIASTQGFSTHRFGGYWNSSGGYDVDSYNGANATCAISFSGQAVIVTLTLTAGCTHPMISVEYHQSGGDGPPRLDRAEMTIG